MSRVLILNPADDVAVALEDLAAGSSPDGLTTPVRDDVAAGHKVARHAIAESAIVRKYGQVIGRARAAIPAGSHVHTHNLARADDSRDA